MTTSPTPGLAGLHHLTLPATDIEASCGWYERVLGARRIARLDHRDGTGRLFAAVLDVPELGTLLQLRADTDTRPVMRDFPLFTLQVRDLAHLQAWIGHLDAVGVAHSPVERRNVGNSVSAASPDGSLLRFQTRPDPGIWQP